MFIESHEDLNILKDFISTQEEIDLINEIDGFKSDFAYRGIKERENVRRFGKFKPSIQNVISLIIPDSIVNLSNRLLSQGLINFATEAVSINQYLPNQGIGPHIDSKSSGDVITILSLGSHTVLNFNNKKEEFSVYFPARCVLQFKNELRNEWQHSISPRSYDEINGVRLERKKRYSIVFRQALI